MKLVIAIPALDEEESIASIIGRTLQARAVIVQRTAVTDVEVAVVSDGSTDRTVERARQFGAAITLIVFEQNRGYGAALRSGFAAATRDLVFYTDGDAQYDPSEMTLLWNALTSDIDLVNGYKISRSDPVHRILIGRIYHHTVKLLFGLKIRDVDCDFRLLRRSIFDRVSLETSSGVICLEMMKKIQDAGFKVAEVPVHHYHRVYGKSQFFNFRRLFQTAIDVAALWVALVVRREHTRRLAPRMTADALPPPPRERG